MCPVFRASGGIDSIANRNGITAHRMPDPRCSIHHYRQASTSFLYLERLVAKNQNCLDLEDEQRMQLLQFANMWPVGKVLGLNADIRTHSGPPGDTFPASASYADDLSELPIPNIDPD
jgi:hypothetical protein